MDLIKNNFISGDLLKSSISSLESRYNNLSRERMDLNYLKKVLAFIHESGDAIEIFGEDVSIHE